MPTNENNVLLDEGTSPQTRENPELDEMIAAEASAAPPNDDAAPQTDSEDSPEDTPSEECQPDPPEKKAVPQTDSESAKSPAGAGRPVNLHLSLTRAPVWKVRLLKTTSKRRRNLERKEPTPNRLSPWFPLMNASASKRKLTKQKTICWIYSNPIKPGVSFPERFRVSSVLKIIPAVLSQSSIMVSSRSSFRQKRRLTRLMISVADFPRMFCITC